MPARLDRWMTARLGPPADAGDPLDLSSIAEGAASPLILEEKPICRLALASLTAECGLGASVRAATSLENALHMLNEVSPSLLLVDLFTLNYDFEGFQRLVAAARAPTVALDDRPNPTFAGLVRQAGAMGYACKSYELEQIAAVIQVVVGGGLSFPAGMLSQSGLLQVLRRAAGLSPRQLEVLKCVAVGMSNQEIARALGITVGTAKLHVHAILKLTGARNRTEAAMIAGRFMTPGLRKSRGTLGEPT